MTNRHSSIQTKELRECRFYWRYMCNDGFSLSSEPHTSQDYCNALNTALTHQTKNHVERSNYVCQMRNAALEQLLPSQELEWISPKNERLCFWLWCFCRLVTRNDPWRGERLVIQFDQRETNRPYIDYGLNPLPFTTQERYDSIVDFLDLGGATLEDKRRLLQKWRYLWEDINAVEHFPTPSKDSDQFHCWLWSYIISNKEYPIEHWFIPKPKTPKEKFNASVAAFDIWQTDVSTKKLFIIRMKKAWSQKKHRLTMGKHNKKSYNFTLTTSTKKLLDEMAESAELSRNEFLEHLIKQENMRKHS